MEKTANRKARLTELQARLLSERAKLTAELREGREALLTPENTSIEDQVSLLHEQYMTLVQHGKERERLASINAALERMESGDFGVCASCDDPIPVPRLEAVPWTSFCVTCQERIENNPAQPLFGRDNSLNGGTLCSDA